MFYTENQGDWVGSGRMTHLEKGDFAGNPEGLVWTGEPNSPLDLKMDAIERESGLSLYEYAKKEPALKAPAIWFPHTILGIATSDLVYDTSGAVSGHLRGNFSWETKGTVRSPAYSWKRSMGYTRVLFFRLWKDFPLVF